MSNSYTLTINVQSPALIGSGEGFGAIIDSDIVFDGFGIPYIPAKRVKGCLRDAALDVQDMFKLAEMKCPVDIEKTFGSAGAEDAAPVYFSNLTIEQYDQNKAWLHYLLTLKDETKQSVYGDILSRDSILEYFTELRQQTAIGDDGVADDHSLRTVRVIKAGRFFSGTILVNMSAEVIETTLKLATLNFRHIGTKRNRGFGEITCSLKNEKGDVPLPQQLEGLCTR